LLAADAVVALDGGIGRMSEAAVVCINARENCVTFSSA
jgi:predicted Rossmann-fold nucleotide-binding protein